MLPIHTRFYGPPSEPRPFANPVPLGLFAVACNNFVTSMYIFRGRSVTTPDVGFGVVLFFCGLTKFIAGMWEFANGRVFGATLFAAYGGFGMAYSTLYIPSFGVTAAYTPHPSQYYNAVGILWAPWFILTVIFLMACVKANIGLVTIFLLLAMDFLTLMICNFVENVVALKVGGAFGFCVCASALYLAASQFLNEDNFWFNLPVGNFRRSERSS